MERMETTVNPEQFAQICDGVWQDRAPLVRGRGFLSGEAALMRAVYCRLCKTVVRPTVSAENHLSLQTIFGYQLGVSCLIELSAHPYFDCETSLKALVTKYQNEIGVPFDQTKRLSA